MGLQGRCPAAYNRAHRNVSVHALPARKSPASPVRTSPANSVSRALAVIGDRWSLLILAAAFQGARRFDDWWRGIGIASNVLAERLNRLQANGCLECVPVAGGRKEYRLSRKGYAIYPVALMFWRFDRQWSRRRTLQPASLVHSCGGRMQPTLVCASCLRAVHAHDVRYEAGPGAGEEPAPPPRVSRRSNVSLSDGARLELLVGDSIDAIGDRWSQQVLAAFFMGDHRYEAIRQRTGASTNVLADRLRLLLDHGLIERRTGPGTPARPEYALTAKGHSVYPIVLTLMSWGDRWLGTKSGPPLILHHIPCGHRLVPVVVCDRCGARPSPRDVRFRRGSPAERRGTA